MTYCRGSLRCETLFDLPTKQAQRAKLNDQMGQPNFWDNQEKAQQIISTIETAQRPAQSFRRPWKLRPRISKRWRSCVRKDASLEDELANELTTLENKLSDFEKPASHQWEW